MAFPLPPVGDCVDESGHINPAFHHDGLRAGGFRKASKAAREICEGCPVLKECQDWAVAFSDWSAVTVAGWTASGTPSAPPWAPPLEEGRRFRRRPVVELRGQKSA